MEESHEISGRSNRPRYSTSSTSHVSALQSAASLESSCSGSSGVLVYHANSIQYEDEPSPENCRSLLVPTPISAATSWPRDTRRRRSERYQRSCWKRLGNTCRKRIPRRTGSVIVFLLNVIESFAFYGAIESTLRLLLEDSSWHETALIQLIKFTAGRILYPIAGFLSDVYLGRYKTIQIGIWLFWSAFALLSLSLALAAGELGFEKLNTFVIPIIAFILICAGSSAIEVAIIPFGVDQLSQGASSHEQSSYFYWYYFGRQLGIMVGILSFYALSLIRVEQDKDCNKYAVSSIQSVVAMTAMTLSLVLMWWFKNTLFIDIQRENPLKEVVNVIYYAATAKDSPPVARRAFRYGEGKKRRMERAKLRYDGLYTSEEVEDVKTFCKILLVVFSLGLCFMTYTGVYVMLEYQMGNIYRIRSDLLLLFPDVFSLWNIVTVMILLPIFNYLILPCAPLSSMRVRIGFGVTFIFFSAVIAAYLEWCVLPLISPDRHYIWQLLPTLSLSLGEMMVFVTGLEFIYAQSPEQMKGFLTGLFYLVFGIFSGAAALFFRFYPITFNHFYNHSTYFIIYSVIGCIGLFMYIIIACLYSNRDRPEEEEFH